MATRFFKAYIDAPFLQAIAQQKPQDMDSDDTKVDTWRHWLKFMRNDAHIYVNTQGVSSEDLAYNPDFALIRDWQNQWLSGCNHIEKGHDSLNKTTTTHTPTFVFCSDKDTPNSNIPMGAQSFDKDLFFKQWTDFSCEKSFSVSKNNTGNNLKTWHDLLEGRCYPNTAFLIVDNYIFSRKEHIINNTIPLIESLIKGCPDQEPIDITIISEQFYTEQNGIVVSADTIKKILDDKLTEYNINLCIIKAKFHDRLILSNYFIITSGNSFTFFNRNGKLALPQPTHISVIPLTVNMTQFMTYSNALRHITTNHPSYEGELKNTLLTKTFPPLSTQGC